MKQPVAYQRLPDDEWNFDSIPDDEAWACLIWEYGRDAIWYHARLPRRNSSASAPSEVGKFYAGNPSPAGKLLNKMRQWQWLVTGKIDFFAERHPWKTLPLIVRHNMCRAIAGLEPVDLPRLGAILNDVSPDDGSRSIEAGRIIEQLQAIEPPLASEEETAFQAEPQKWLPGGNGLDDVTKGVIQGELYLRKLRKTMASLLANKITRNEAQTILQRAFSGEIQLHQMQREKTLADAGYFAVAFRGNWRLNKRELVSQFEQWLDAHCPRRFRGRASGQRSLTRGPDGIQIMARRGKKTEPVEPSRALRALGVRRRKLHLEQAGLRNWVSFAEHYDSHFSSRSGEQLKNAQTNGSKDQNLANEITDQLFPRNVKSVKKSRN